MRSSLFCAAGALLAIAITAAASIHDPRVQQPMKAVVGPASDLLFAVGGEVDPENGPSAAQVPDARWKAAGEAAGRMKTVADDLLRKDVVREGEWSADARKMSELSAAAAKAASTKNGRALAQVANDLGDTCSACHGKYKPQT